MKPLSYKSTEIAGCVLLSAFSINTGFHRLLCGISEVALFAEEARGKSQHLDARRTPKGGDFQIKLGGLLEERASPLLPLPSERVSEDTDAAEPTRQLCFISAPERLSLPQPAFAA